MPDIAIPALTVRQPWAWCIEHGKPVENRTWQTRYRGPLAIHAGARSRFDESAERHPIVRDTGTTASKPSRTAAGSQAPSACWSMT